MIASHRIVTEGVSAHKTGLSLRRRRSVPRVSVRRLATQATLAHSDNIKLTGKHLVLTPALKEYANEKFGHMANKFDGMIIGDVDVKFSVHGPAGRNQVQRTEVTIQTKNGVIRGEEEAEHINASIDGVCDKLTRKLRKLKEKGGKHQGKAQGAAKRGSESLKEVLSPALELADDEEDEYEDIEEVIREERVNLVKMSAVEAARRLDKSDAPCLMYEDDSLGGPRVIFRRNKGGYGVYVPF
mmetsp:Transcript_13268/g.48310  ORF Transcript_13268/g.48310 Transcript_13268/m.48310 type:complete len:241 (+) Transcript_13268:148-870(+)